MPIDVEVIALRRESLKLVVQAEALLGRLEAHQESLERYLRQRRQEDPGESDDGT